MNSPENIASVVVKANTSQLAQVRDFIAMHASRVGFSDKVISEIRLAVDEAFTNIIKHAYKGKKNGEVRIQVGFENREFWVSLCDKGTHFDLGAYKEPNVMEQIRNKKRGGMGVYLIRKLMDTVQYKQVNGYNQIKMVKHL